jgi:hypothetical protein
MSKVQLIQPNYQQQPGVGGQKTANYAAKQSFGANNSCEDKLIKIVSDKLDSHHKNPLQKFLKGLYAKLFNNQGEIENQLINATFTATLAGLVIWKNPFSAKDQKTKDRNAYAAVRQPISAGIAMTGGLAMTLAVNRFMDEMANSGALKSMDHRFAPTKDYAKRMFNKEYAKGTFMTEYIEAKKNPETLKEFKIKYKLKSFDKNWHKKAKKNFFEVYFKDLKDQRKNLLINLIGEKPENIKFDKETKIISVMKNGKLTEIGQNIPNLNTESEFKAYLKSNNLYMSKFIDIMNKHYNFEVYGESDGKVVAGNIKSSSMKKLTKILGMEFLRDIGFAGDATAFAKVKIEKDELPKNTEAPTVKVEEESLALKLDMLSDDKNTNIIQRSIKPCALQDESSCERMGHGIGKASERTVKVHNGGVEGEKIKLQQIFERLDHKEKEKNLTKLLKDNTLDVLTDFSKKLKVLKPTGEPADILDFAKNIATRRISGLSKFKTFNTIVGIGFNVIMTAITCTALNWVYPRFIEKFIPSLNKKGGDE